MRVQLLFKSSICYSWIINIILHTHKLATGVNTWFRQLKSSAWTTQVGYVCICISVRGAHVMVQLMRATLWYAETDVVVFRPCPACSFCRDECKLDMALISTSYLFFRCDATRGIPSISCCVCICLESGTGAALGRFRLTGAALVCHQAGLGEVERTLELLGRVLPALPRWGCWGCSL